MMSYAMQLLIHRGDFCHGCALLPLARMFLLRTLSSGPRVSRSLRESYQLLQLELPDEGESSPAQVKEAYLRMAKLYHPDSGAATADKALFALVEEAYRAVLAHQSQLQSRGGSMEDEEDEEKVKGVAPQHRHYLSYEGVGSGTPSQRERQYRQFRVDRAVEQVLDYRQKEHETAAAAEGALVERDVRQRSRQIKVTQAVERLVEDLIQESMSRGDFRNLSGAGKPINKFEHNPYADPMTHNLNRILIDNGYQPPWIVTQRDIREDIAQIRERLLQGRARLADPMTPREHAQWQQLCGAVAEDLKKLNKTVDNFNLIAPMLTMQMVHFSLEREIDRAEKAALQGRQERKMERVREWEEQRREREREKKDKIKTPQHSRQGGLLAWMQNLLK
ncbi:dnaJ homolog subfamily C member 28 [Coregonus clupeaformis]|uniref:dnaJ homolog subfamily C member 28 n=1 Tax=Coregonus clupeaformis TaxID=59861 RepID=UPI001E1C52A0|nr:dnaJ homolog subfamily C member 28 [Coregonus clupeaformis]XP_045070907.1 dnaJ homolog subfamily C member 28 [Coregonus clupeaformis]XP_045070908.1 dnaJ homolog subfamily C member 28 [Coregonus clupeaformis]